MSCVSFLAVALNGYLGMPYTVLWHLQAYQYLYSTMYVNALLRHVRYIKWPAFHTLALVVSYHTGWE